jgi:HPr kinase/phosphorylase
MIVHATTVSVDGAGLLITGPSGSGKSGLAIRMIALGARLVADDRSLLSRPGEGPPLAEAPATIRGLVEARGLGLIELDAAGPTPLAAVVDMSVAETARLPEARTTDILGFSLPVVSRVDSESFPAALMLWLRAGARRVT